MSIKDTFGLDGFDLAIHAAITGFTIFAVAAAGGGEEAFVIGGPILLAISLGLLAVRRTLALRRRRLAGLTGGSVEMAAERIAELEQRVSDLEATQGRMSELEERLDFAERLLARPVAEPGRAPGESR